ncbi:hypothetical protein [Paenibacillus larvae]|uniref:hypothetical protein n=1 Tax=Paenibacillus larvae TaxID=1464 RepID=UPI002891B966|nr:hypothetical protein [Paenibacillus larvae]MDT2281297.1 hypothetical protein [Paenibacillus larvae]
MTEEHLNKKTGDENGQQEETVEKAAGKPVDSSSTEETTAREMSKVTEDAKKTAAEAIDADKEVKRKAAAEARAGRAASQSGRRSGKTKRTFPKSTATG